MSDQRPQRALGEDPRDDPVDGPASLATCGQRLLVPVVCRRIVEIDGRQARAPGVADLVALAALHQQQGACDQLAPRPFPVTPRA